LTVDKASLFGGGLRALVSGGSAIRLVNWVAQRPDDRYVDLHLKYTDKGEGLPKAHFSLVLGGNGGDEQTFEGETFESVVTQAVVALHVK